ncbi:MAG: PD-(D/E)XK nuclease superfamily protein [Candidatus Argoarchaeum ethanivorans]|uniref:PD-(D/E)XK nuclease superfamily protein n=1 Tax=Candidatus Argoarchaeum ethanivorans TaxID=2608793 RepID=A0A812A076_9EURY|nr:MAG: PD-(D/E)XK nuclease superfamily protein [Candidatus Argoarchaeum ethanivorans]
MKNYKHSEITEKIIGASYKVHNTLGSGFLEKVYQSSLAIELRTIGFSVDVEKPITIYYHDEIVGNYVADIVIRWKDHSRDQSCKRTIRNS